MNVLFIGFGSIAAKHFKALQTLEPDIIVYALRSGRNVSQIEGVSDIFNWDDVPANIDFGIISNPTFLHKDAIENLIARSIPIFLEKPIFHSLDGLDDIAVRIREKKLLSYVACNLRFLPILSFLKQYLLDNHIRINEVSVYCGSYLPDWRPGQDFRKIYSADASLGGGAHLDLFHELDYTCWIFGMPAHTNSTLASKSSLEIDAIDYAAYQFSYPSFTAQITLNYYRRDAKRTIEIVGEEYTLIADLLKNTITDNFGNLKFEDKSFSIADTYLEQMKYFINILRGDRQSFNSFEMSLQILKICLSHG